MSTNFPSALDTFTNPNWSDSLNAAAVPHAEQHANANDAIEALQAKVGINGSAVATSLDYRISTAETGLGGKISSSEKGSANGVATLGFDGKVPSSQLPPLDYIPTSEKGAAGGVAGLDEAGKVPAAQLPSYVDDVLEYANLAAFPVTGEAGKIYVALNTNKTYRWSGSAYIYITSGAVDSVAGKTGVVVLAKADVGLGSVDDTSDANKPISTATQTALNAKQNAATAVTKDSATGMANIPAGTSAQRPASPPFGAQRANSTTSAMEWWDGTAWAPMGGGAPASFRNKIINGAFGINQRVYVSGAATTAGQYTLDRWKVTGTGGITFSTVNNKTTVTIPAGQTLQQVIEGLNLATGYYVLSWEGTAQGRIGAGSYGASGSVNASITGGTNTTIEFNTGTVANVQLEAGSIATPFEHRPYGLELSLCQRYYEVIATRVVGSFPGTGQASFVAWFYKVTKRASPTVVNTTAAAGQTIDTNVSTHYTESIMNNYAIIGAGSTASAEL